MTILKRFFGIGIKNRQIIFAFVYMFLILFFVYYRFVADNFKINSLNLKKYIVRHHNKNSFKEPQLRMTNVQFEFAQRTKYVLFWIKFWNLPSWYLGSEEAGQEMLKILNCPVTNCFFTHNRTYLPNITQFDAVLFHGAEYLKDEVPRERTDNQLYVLANLESPFLTFEDLTRYPNFFNATMTYRFDSDIPWYYGRIIDKSDEKVYVAPSINPNWMEPEDDFFDDKLYKIVTKKNKAIAWFVSNCNSSSNRELLADKLGKIIQIDIFGKCGKLHCQKKSSQCFEMLTSDYMFYLSFENALCVDYVTEKLYQPLSNYVIPIVFNGASMTRFAPPKSFIDVNDYNTIDDLIKYLKYLMDNPKEYIKYFWWKKYYKIEVEISSFRFGFCDLCMKINDHEFMERKHFYSNINSWWRDESCTNKPKIQL